MERQSETGQLDRTQRDQLMHLFAEADEKLVNGSRRTPPIPRDEASLLAAVCAAVRTEYAARLPVVTMSRCPFCGQTLQRSFDPWGLDGLWWQSRLAAAITESPACPHFAVLQGAVNLNGLPPKGGGSETRPGPEVPFVILRLLEIPTMVAVVSSIEMDNGYRAFPIAYFRESPGDEMLAPSWTKSRFTIKLRGGGTGWNMRADPWDFELRPWVKLGKVKWVNPGDASWATQSGPWTGFPYKKVTGRREQQVIKGDCLRTEPPPHGQPIDPFSE